MAKKDKGRDKMSASEAGQKGGKAYHEKRGQQGSDDSSQNDNNNNNG